MNADIFTSRRREGREERWLLGWVIYPQIALIAPIEPIAPETLKQATGTEKKTIE